MIGRKKEIEILTKSCEQEESKLIAVYGRRRIGKTYLINHMFSEHKKECIFFRFTGSYMLDSSTQLENFIEAIYDWFKIESKKEVKNWMSGFNYLKYAITEYEKAIKLIKESEKLLEQAEGKIQKVMEKNGTLKIEEME